VVSKVQRETRDAFDRGAFLLREEPPCESRAMRITFYNENLVAELDGEVVACVPDIISCLRDEPERAGLGEDLKERKEDLNERKEKEKWQAEPKTEAEARPCGGSGISSVLATEELQQGVRVAVVVLPVHPLLRTPRALAAVGPVAFGLEGVAKSAVGR
jgi:DUF917 family protein